MTEHETLYRKVGRRYIPAPDAAINPWGRDGLMAIAAHRYCLGRMTYIVGDCADWLIEHWGRLPPGVQAIIQRDTEEAFELDDDARAAGNEYKPLGHDCDRRVWERVRKLWVSPSAALSSNQELNP